MMNKQKELSLIRLDSISTHEVSEDFSLPDYMPEVRRIISCDAVALPENKYIDRDEIILSGIVAYTVLYVGEDGKITSAPLSSEYSVKFSCQGVDMASLGISGIVSHTALESALCRATGPRRLTLSSKLRSRAFSSRSEPLCESVSVLSRSVPVKQSASDEMSIERRTVPVSSSRVAAQSLTGNASGEFRVSGGVPISCHGAVGITDARHDKGDVKILGDIYLSVLSMGEDGGYFSTRVKAPFEERLPSVMQGGEENNKRCVAATGRVASVNITPSDEGVYCWDMEYDIDVTETLEYTVDVTEDVYSTEYETSESEKSYNTLVCLRNGSSRLSVATARQISGEGEKYVSHVSGRATVDRAECSSAGKLIISGSCNLHVITVGGGEIQAEEVTLPVKLECDCRPSDGKTPSVICDIGVLYADARIDKDRLSVDAELCITVLACSTEETKCVTEFTLDRDRPVGLPGSCVKIYFPEEGEGMWEIGKRYHCEVKSITPHPSSGGVIIRGKGKS